jgi:hypothetical protein
MKLLQVGVVAVFMLTQVTTTVSFAQSVQSNLVISQVQTGNSSSSRLVEVYNNGNDIVDVTGWCIRYATASTNTVRACFTTNSAAQHLLLPAKSYVLVGSTALGITADYTMSEGLGSGPSGAVLLTDAAGVVRDTFGWGAAAYFEGAPKASDSSSRVYERKLSLPDTYVDENNNSTDFFNAALRGGDEPYRTGSLIEVIDECRNLDGIQEDVPEGLEKTEDGECTEPPSDVCANIDGIQTVLPDNMEVDNLGQCYKDKCDNLGGFQADIPQGYVQRDEQCQYDLKPVIVTELLPNPDGDDNGNEFIEFYNPNTLPVDLTHHVFYVNGSETKTHRFLPGTVIEATSYLVIYNKDSTPSFTLTNSTGSLALSLSTGDSVVAVPDYIDAKTGESWALIGGEWQYTTILTPGGDNRPSVYGQGEIGIGLTDCGEGRERNPATNRCRNIPSSSSLQPCKEGQYRSEDTNRCRSIALAAASVLKPCADNQFRNPATNRCKNIASSDDLADCGEGRERNPTTNRCRNVLGASVVSKADFAVEPIADGAVAFVGWWALGGVAALAIGYATWEWRQEIRRYVTALVSKISGGKA